MKRLRWASLLLAALAPAPSSAGQRPFISAFDTNIVSTGSVELEQWMWVVGRTPSNPTDPAYWLWWGPVVGVTRHIELAVPFQVSRQGAQTQLTSFEADVRWRLFAQDDRAGFQALLRTSYHQSATVSAQEPSRFDFNLSSSYGSMTDLHIVVEVGGQLALPAPLGAAPTAALLGTYDVGVAYPFPEAQLQLSVESFGQIGIVDNVVSRHWVGGSIAWTPGRFWATLGLLVGLTSKTPEFMPRLIWAIAI